jgi:hypothetical protein
VTAAFEGGAAVAAPLEPAAASPVDASREAHLSRCHMTVALALPIFEHVDRQKVIGVLEIARTQSDPTPSYAFLSSLATCLQVCLRPACLTTCVSWVLSLLFTLLWMLQMQVVFDQPRLEPAAAPPCQAWRCRKRASRRRRAD